MLGDERRSDAWIARARGDVHGVCGGVEDGFAGGIRGDCFGIEGVASFAFSGGLMRIGALEVPGFAACFADIDSGELLVPLYFRSAERKMASVTLSRVRMTRSLMPQFFPHVLA
jgi:hypothetical protein